MSKNDFQKHNSTICIKNSNDLNLEMIKRFEELESKKVIGITLSELEKKARENYNNKGSRT